MRNPLRLKRYLQLTRMRGDFLGTRAHTSVQNSAEAWNGRLPLNNLISELRMADELRTRGSWVQILPGALARQRNVAIRPQAGIQGRQQDSPLQAIQ